MDSMSRREMLLCATTALVAHNTSAGAGSAPDSRRATKDIRGHLTTPPEAIISTRSGRVRGFRRNGIYIFRGVPYGTDPSGEARFLPAQPVRAWSEIRSCLAYGPVVAPAAAHLGDR